MNFPAYQNTGNSTLECLIEGGRGGGGVEKFSKLTNRFVRTNGEVGTVLKV